MNTNTLNNKPIKQNWLKVICNQINAHYEFEVMDIIDDGTRIINTYGRCEGDDYDVTIEGSKYKVDCTGDTQYFSYAEDVVQYLISAFNEHTQTSAPTTSKIDDVYLGVSGKSSHDKDITRRYNEALEKLGTDGMLMWIERWCDDNDINEILQYCNDENAFDN